MSDEQDGGSRLQKRNLAAEKKLTETDPIDEEAQERIVKLLEQDQAAQESSSCRSLGAVLGLICLLHGYLTIRQMFQPWSSKQAAYFIDLPAYSIAASYAVSTAAYALNFRQLLLRQIQYRHSSKAAALLGAILASVLWTITLSMAVQLRQEGWKPALKFWWLPLGPLALVGLVEYTFRMFTSSRADIRKLRTKMYSCKTA